LKALSLLQRKRNVNARGRVVGGVLILRDKGGRVWEKGLSGKLGVWDWD